jgi:hypothetical protein
MLQLSPGNNLDNLDTALVQLYVLSIKRIAYILITFDEAGRRNGTNIESFCGGGGYKAYIVKPKQCLTFTKDRFAV